MESVKQLIMRKLRRPPHPGRAAVIVPDGFLFGEGVGARVKEELLTNFNLHTIVRLPKGIFAPYTGIQSNLLFFDRSGPTKEIWYYETPLPTGRKNYSKTAPMQYEEFADCLTWWKNRAENDRAWRIDFAANYKQARAEAEPHWAASRGTSGKNRIKPELFLTIEIPLPSLEEQRRIVARIEDLAAKIEEARDLRKDAQLFTIVAYLDNLQIKMGTLKKLQAETAAEIDALLPSILDKAFKGEL